MKLWLPSGTAPSLFAGRHAHPVAFWAKASKYLTQRERDLTYTQPLVQIAILDKDIGTGEADATLATGLIRLDGTSGAVDAMTLEAASGHAAGCKVSFSYEIVPYTPAPPATLHLHALEVDGLDGSSAPRSRRRGAEEPSGNVSKSRGMGSEGRGRARGGNPKMAASEALGAFLRFTLLEV